MQKAALLATALVGLLAFPLDACAGWFRHGVGPPPSACTFSTNPATDGCSAAQAHGTTLQSAYGYPSAATPQTLLWVNVIQGSTYTNGTYSWTTSGGGCSTPATGTVTFSGGAITAYTVGNIGAGCTSRPTISIPGGAGAGDGTAKMVPTVYQLTPHGMSSPWSQAGVDFPVGADHTLTYKTPPTGLPGCASFASSTVTIAANCTLTQFDFTNIYVHVNCPSGCTVVFQNDKFQTPVAQDSALHVTGNGTNVTVEFSDITDGATLGGSEPGAQVAGVRSTDPNGTFTFDHNYCFALWSKCLSYNGASNTGSQTTVEWANLFVDICLGTGNHGEAEYTFSGNTSQNQTITSHYNTYLERWVIGQIETANTATAAPLEADTTKFSNSSSDHNVILSPGPWAFTGSDNSAHSPVTGSADEYLGTQGGGTFNGTMIDGPNLYDYTGVFFPWNASGTTGLTFTGNKNAVTGNACATGANNCN